MINSKAPSKYLKYDIVIISLIITIPFLFYLYTLAPLNQRTWDVLFIEIDSGDMEYVDYYLWLLFYKLITLSFSMLWFLSSRNKWYRWLSIPIGAEVYKFLRIVSSTDLYWEGSSIGDFYISLLLSVPLVIALYFLKNRVNYFKLKNQTLPRALDAEINKVLLSNLQTNNKKLFISIKAEIKDLKQKKSELSKEEYLKELIAISDKLIID